MTTRPFEVNEADPHFMHLSAKLMDRQAPIFDEWLAGITARGSESGEDIIKAVCMTFATELSVLGTVCAKPEGQREFAAIACKMIFDILLGLTEPPRARDN